MYLLQRGPGIYYTLFIYIRKVFLGRVRSLRLASGCLNVLLPLIPFLLNPKSKEINQWKLIAVYRYGWE